MSHADNRRDARGARLRPPGQRPRRHRSRAARLALAGLPGDGAAACAFAALAGEYQERFNLATTRLAAARGKYPENAELEPCTVRLLEAQAGDADLEPYLLDVLRWSSMPAQRLWAFDRLKELRAQQRRNAPQ